MPPLLVAGSLIVALLVALPQLAAPLTGDQALYLVGARELLEGSRLYVDFWDIKQPGVYLFYAASIALFGDSSFGLHCAELLWLLATSWVAMRLLARHLRHRWLAGLAPIAIAAAYYQAVEPWHLTQIEILPALPACAVIALLLPGPDGTASRWRAAAAGVCAGMVGLFVLPQLLAPLAAGFACIGFGRDRPALALSFAAGVAAFAALVAGGFAAIGALSALADNLFVYPLEAPRPADDPGGLQRVQPGARWFASRFAPWVLLAGVAAADLRRPRLAPLTAVCTVWSAVTCLVLLLETRPSWPFHFLLLVPPLGLLSLRGLDLVMSSPWLASWGMARRAALAAAVVLGAVAFGMRTWWPQAGRTLDFVQQGEGRDWADHHCLVEPEHALARAGTAFLDDEVATPGPIYVFGSPVVLLYADRRPALRWSGWGWEVYRDREWDALDGELRAAQPVYVLVAPCYEPWLARRAPAVLATLAELYEAEPAGPLGTWYRLK